jgi:methanogenic corrinoid protein MtbC1
MSKELIDAITEMREEDVQAITDKLLASGASPVAILDDCREAMAVIGQRFEAGDCFVPELILAGEMLGQVSAKVKPHLQAQVGGQKKLGRVVIGTVEGDIHDIGKDIVTFMLDVNGFDVHDIGVDVPAAKFVEEVKVQALKDAGLRDGVKIMIGGGQVDDQIRDYTGADAYGKDAMAAVALAKQWVGG